MRLVYGLESEPEKRTAPEGAADHANLLSRTLSIIAARLGRSVDVAPLDGTNFRVDVPAALVDRLCSIRRLVESPGVLQFRLIAGQGPEEARPLYDLAAERRRLQEWIDTQGPDSLDRLRSGLAAPPPTDGGPALRWLPRRILPLDPAQSLWRTSFTAVESLAGATVPLYRPEDWNDGRIPAGHPPVLIELLAVDFGAPAFSQEDLDARFARAEVGYFGGAVRYRLLPERKAAFDTWAVAHEGQHCATILDGYVIAAPKLSGRHHPTVIHTGSSEAEAQDLASILRSGPIPSAPKLRLTQPLPE